MWNVCMTRWNNPLAVKTISCAKSRPISLNQERSLRPQARAPCFRRHYGGPRVSFQILGDFPEQVRRLDNAARPHILEAVHGLVWSVHSQFPANVSRVPGWEALEVFLRRNRSSPRVLNAWAVACFVTPVLDTILFSRKTWYHVETAEKWKLGFNQKKNIYALSYQASCDDIFRMPCYHLLWTDWLRMEN